MSVGEIYFKNFLMTIICQRKCGLEVKNLVLFSFCQIQCCQPGGGVALEKSRRKDSKDTVLDELIVLFKGAKPRGSQNVTKSGCNKNQENLNHKHECFAKKPGALLGKLNQTIL